jgi:hypothetical protein
MSLAQTVAARFTLPQRVASRFGLRAACQRILTAFGVNDLEQLSKMGRSFGVISAYRSGLSKSENQKRHGQLMADLQKAGLKAHTFKSQWEDMDTKVTHKEKSIFVPKIGFKELNELGKKYEQDAVLFKDHSGSIGIYFKDNTAVMAFNDTGEMDVSKSKDPKQEYSRGRGVSFGLQLIDDQKFHYSDNKPVTQDQIVKTLKSKGKSTAPETKEPESKTESDSDWFEEMGKPAQKHYCEEHPGSEHCK